MIQRIQSFWLFLAAAFNAVTLVLCFYSVPATTTMPALQVKVTDHYPSLLLTAVCVLLPLVTIFFYGNRKKQLSMSMVSVLATCGLLSTLLARTNTVMNQNPGRTGTYGVSGVMLALSAILIILAIIGIRKDEKLVKSVERLR